MVSRRPTPPVKRGTEGLTPPAVGSAAPGLSPSRELGKIISTGPASAKSRSAERPEPLSAAYRIPERPSGDAKAVSRPCRPLWAGRPPGRKSVLPGLPAHSPLAAVRSKGNRLRRSPRRPPAGRSPLFSGTTTPWVQAVPREVFCCRRTAWENECCGDSTGRTGPASPPLPSAKAICASVPRIGRAYSRLPRAAALCLPCAAEYGAPPEAEAVAAIGYRKSPL